MSKTIRLTYYGVDGEGPTVTAAKADAGRKIERALAGSYSPEVLSWQGHAVLLWREPTGWGSRLIAQPHPDGGSELRSGTQHGHCHEHKDDARASAILNLAQLGWQEEDGESVPAILGDVSNQQTYRTQLAEWRHWVTFQLRYRAARRAGLNSNECHSYAGRDPACDYAALEARVRAASAQPQPAA